MALASWVEYGYTLYGDRRVAFIAAGITALLLIWAIVSVVEEWLPVATVPATLPSIPTQARIDVQAIPSEHLFGSNQIGLLQATNLALTLEGVLTDTDARQSTAIISRSGGVGAVYRPGDTVMEGVVLYSVAPDKVILRVRGQLESLPLVRPKLEWAPPPASLWNASTR